VITYPGTGYVQPPSVTFSSPVSGGTTAIAEAFLNSSGGISTIRIVNAGFGYTTRPTITISAGSTISSGNFIFGEQVSGSISGAIGFVKDWNFDTRILKVSGMATDFSIGDVVVGAASSARYFLRLYQTYELQSAYDNRDVIESEADSIIDFSEINPFGEV
jgi:hypothetical protein